LSAGSDGTYRMSPNTTVNRQGETMVRLLYYTKAGFVDRPVQVQGKKTIDACLIGTFQGPSATQKNVVLAFRGTVGAWATDWLK
jgi:hypothetical protein